MIKMQVWCHFIINGIVKSDGVLENVEEVCKWHVCVLYDYFYKDV